MKKSRVAFVIQRYGVDVNGGAETLCRNLAEKMTGNWDIEVLTSCAREYVKRFENDYLPGTENINGVTVRRFPIDYLRSDYPIFSELNRKYLDRTAKRKEEIQWLKDIGPYCSSLIEFVKNSSVHYDFYFFFTYLYATTTLILPHVKNRSFLIPCAHDEPTLYGRIFDDFFDKPKGLVFLTPEEHSLVKRRAKKRIASSHIIGGGVEIPDETIAECFMTRFKINGDFILYVGRIQREKGCHELFKYYLSLPEKTKEKYPLVLIGSEIMDIPQDKYIISTGFISDDLKISAMTAASITVMPSFYESFNMVILESWLCNTPVLVNGNCDVLREHCRRSNGGLWYRNFEEFQACLLFLLQNGDLSKQMADNGKAYTKDRYSWDIISTKYNDLISNYPQ